MLWCHGFARMHISNGVGERRPYQEPVAILRAMAFFTTRPWEGEGEGEGIIKALREEAFALLDRGTYCTCSLKTTPLLIIILLARLLKSKSTLVEPAPRTVTLWSRVYPTPTTVCTGSNEMQLTPIA